MTPEQLEQLFEDADALLTTSRAFGLIEANTYNFGLHIIMRMKHAGVPRLILAPKELHGRALKIDGILITPPPVAHLHECIDILQQLHFSGGIMNGPDVAWIEDDEKHANEHFTLDPFLSAGVAWDEKTPIIFAINCNSVGKANDKIDTLIQSIDADPGMIDDYITTTTAAA